MPKLSSKYDNEMVLRASVELGVVLLKSPELCKVEWLDNVVRDGKESTRYLVTVEGGSHERAH